MTTTIEKDIMFVKQILPDHYSVTAENGSIHCKSPIGIRLPDHFNSKGNKVDDAEDERHWQLIFFVIKQHFGKRFSEVFHNTCFCHVDFTIYLKRL